MHYCLQAGSLLVFLFGASAYRKKVRQKLALDLEDQLQHTETVAEANATAAAFMTWPWWWQTTDETPEGGCKQGWHIEIPQMLSDHHDLIPLSLGFGKRSSQNFVLEKSIGPGEVVRGECRTLTRTVPILAEQEWEDVWTFEDTDAWDHLHGEMAVACKNGKLELLREEYNCREYLPFSTIHEHFPDETKGNKKRKEPDWHVPIDAGRFDNWEIGYYDCGVPPPQVVMKEAKCSAPGPDCLPEAAKACTDHPGCQAVSVPAASSEEGLRSILTPDPLGDKFHLLKGGPSSCPPIESAMRFDWAKDEEVRVLRVAAGGRSTGIVAESWEYSEKSRSGETVKVKFCNLQQGCKSPKVELVHFSQLRPMTSLPGHRIGATKIRERKMHCGSMKAHYSCDVNSKEDAMILPLKSGMSPEIRNVPPHLLLNTTMILSGAAKYLQENVKESDCHLACATKLNNITLAQACCVFHKDKDGRGVCALMPGKPFDIKMSPSIGCASDIPGEPCSRPMKFMNENPLADESAANCFVKDCARDPTCNFGSMTHFEAPLDALVPPGHVKLYFDFSRPLSMPFAYSTGNRKDHVGIFHFTSKQNEASHAKDGTRLIRVVGSVPDDATGAEFIRASRTPIGFVAHGGALSKKKLADVQKHLEQICELHGKRHGRELSAPRIDLETRDHCSRKFSVRSPEFEPCMVEVGCRRNQAQKSRKLMPFHGPWFPQLPSDMRAWQQPAPMCCGTSYCIDSREEDALHEFFENIGFTDPDNINLEEVEDTTAKRKMKDELDEGSNQMKHVLGQEVHDKATLDYLVLFLKEAKNTLSASLYELQEEVDEDGDSAFEVGADGNALLQVHEEGDVVAPSGQRAFHVAQWNAQHGAFLQIDDPNGGNNSLARQTAETAYARIVDSTADWIEIAKESALWAGKKVHKFMNWAFKKLKKWIIPATVWIVENPKTALFLSKIALAMRNQLCKKFSYYIYGKPEVTQIGLIGKAANVTSHIKEQLTPATLLSVVQSAMNWDKMKALMEGLGGAVFTQIMAVLGVAGGPITAALGATVKYMGDLAFEAAKESAELLIYQEIAKDIPSNIFDMLFSKCLYKRNNTRELTLTGISNEASAGLEHAANLATSALNSFNQQASMFGGWMSSHFGNSTA